MKLVFFILVIIALIIMIIGTTKSSFGNNENFNDIIKTFKYYDENNNLIDHLKLEIDEQKDAFKYINEEDIVLELGGRYGSVSVIVTYKQKNNGNLVVLEPDKDIINSLYKNKLINNANFVILNKYISNDSKKIIKDGYGTRLGNIINKNDPLKITYNDFKNQFPLNFNVLIADCEGCLCDFIYMIEDDINNYNKILFEADVAKSCDYKKLITYLITKGFRIEKNDNNFRYVLLK